MSSSNRSWEARLSLSYTKVFSLRTKENLTNLPKDAIASVDGSEIWRLPVEMYETFAKNGAILHFWCKFQLLHATDSTKDFSHPKTPTYFLALFPNKNQDQQNRNPPKKTAKIPT